jgi:hypothetical protein
MILEQIGNGRAMTTFKVIFEQQITALYMEVLSVCVWPAFGNILNWKRSLRAVGKFRFSLILMDKNL